MREPAWTIDGMSTLSVGCLCTTCFFFTIGASIITGPDYENESLRELIERGFTFFAGGFDKAMAVLSNVFTDSCLSGALAMLFFDRIAYLKYTYEHCFYSQFYLQRILYSLQHNNNEYVTFDCDVSHVCSSVEVGRSPRALCSYSVASCE